MKKNIYIFLFSLLTLSFVSQTGTTILDSILSGGIYRKYRLYVPTMYNGTSARPLVLNLHGLGSNSSDQMLYANFMPVADTANFLVVQPDGTKNNGSQFWNAGLVSVPNDVLFISELIDSLDLNYNIDNDCVYSCGMSNGGIMSYYMACTLPNKIAAIASVTGSMFNAWFSCAPSRPFPVMEIHGTSDATVPYLGDGIFANIDTVVKKWRKHNNCNPAPITYSVPDINLTDNSTAINYKYTGGDNGSSVELYKVIGGSHSWPGAYPVFANTNQDFNATVEIWKFFRKYKISNFIIGITENEKNSVDMDVFPNPANDLIMIRSNKRSSELCVEIYDLNGKLIKTVINRELIDVSELERSVYMMRIKTNENTLVKRIILTD